MFSRILLLTLLLFILNGCKKTDENKSTEPSSELSTDKWTKVNSKVAVVSDKDAMDFTVTNQNGFLYMDQSYYYSFGADYSLLSSYSFGNNTNIPYNSFINGQVFWSQVITSFGQANEEVTFQQFSTDYNPVKCNYYDSRSQFHDDREYKLQSLTWGVVNTLCVGTAAVRTERANNPYYYEVFDFDAWATGKIHEIDFPDSAIKITAAFYLDPTHIYIVGDHCYMNDGLTTSKVSDLPPYSTYKGSINKRAFFTVDQVQNPGSALEETSDGITFKETIPGLRVSKVFKPSNGYLICYNDLSLNSSRKFVLINLADNTSVEIDANGIDSNTFDGFDPKGIIITTDKRLIMMSNQGMYVRLMK